MLRLLRNLLIIVFLFGLITGFIDYTRFVSGDNPIFNISTYNEVSHIQSYRGLFYQASRKTKINNNESLMDSSDIKFYVLSHKIDVPSRFNEDKFDFTIKTEVNNSCDGVSNLYYASEKIKVYTYCLNNIELIENGKDKGESFISYLKKDESIYEDFIDLVPFIGVSYDQSTEVFKSHDDSISNLGITVYKCNRPSINDIYIAPNNTPFISDFCTYKDDDFKFISKIEEVNDNNENIKEKEVFYEDENNYYEFDEVKSDKVFIVSPAVRLSGEKRYSLKEVLLNNILTIDELEEKGLKFNKVPKTS